MLITPAFAQATPAGGSENFLFSMLPFMLIFVIMYFLILRPQQRKVKEHQEMIKNLRRGDSVVTSGGLLGRITKIIDDDVVEIELSDSVKVRQLRSMISELKAKTEPAKGE